MIARLPVKGGFWTLVDEDVAERFKGIPLRAVLNFMPGVRGKAAAKSAGGESQLALFVEPAS